MWTRVDLVHRKVRSVSQPFSAGLRNGNGDNHYKRKRRDWGGGVVLLLFFLVLMGMTNYSYVYDVDRCYLGVFSFYLVFFV
jgi:hypothetical protein